MTRKGGKIFSGGKISKGSNYSKQRRYTMRNEEFANSSNNSDKLKQRIMNEYNDPFLEFRGDKVILYHGSLSKNVDSILEDGIRGGDNTGGGTHGSFENPKLFLARDKETASKYGEVIEVQIPVSKFDDFDFSKEIDGLGDTCYVIEGKDWNKPLIHESYLYHPERSHDDGICDIKTCEFCIEEKDD